MTIRDIKVFMRRLWDWSIFKDCFGLSKSSIGDADGLLSHCGAVLLLEGKSMADAPAIGAIFPNQKGRNDGQFQLWHDMAGIGANVIVFWGEPIDENDPLKKQPQLMQLWPRFAEEPNPVIASSIKLAQNAVSRWWKWAEEEHKAKTLNRSRYREFVRKFGK